MLANMKVLKWKSLIKGIVQFVKKKRWTENRLSDETEL